MPFRATNWTCLRLFVRQAGELSVLQITRNTNRQNTSDLRKHHQFHNTYVLQKTALPALRYPVYLCFFPIWVVLSVFASHVLLNWWCFVLFVCVSAIFMCFLKLQCNMLSATVLLTVFHTVCILFNHSNSFSFLSSTSDIICHLNSDGYVKE